AGQAAAAGGPRTGFKPPRSHGPRIGRGAAPTTRGNLMRLFPITTAIAVGLATGVPFRPTASPSEVITVDVGGEPVHASATIPDAMPGTYLYERQGEPVIVLGADNQGEFQAHG